MVSLLGKLKENVWFAGCEVSYFEIFPVACKPNCILINTCQAEALIVNVMRLCDCVFWVKHVCVWYDAIIYKYIYSILF